MTEGNGKVRELPKGWLEIELEKVCSKITDGSHNPPEKQLLGFPMLSAKNIHNDLIDFEDVRYISEAAFKHENLRTNIEKNDVLLTIVGTIGRTAVVKENMGGFAIQRSVALLKPIQINSKYLSLTFRNPFFQRELLQKAKGTAQKGIYLKTLQTLKVPIAPINEQNRIVEKIEELFSELDQGIENLKTAQKQLKVYRQAVLKWAFEGKLTEQWRQQAQQQGDLKTGEELLAQIKAERENRYQQQIAEWEAAVKTWEANGKPAKKPSKPQKIQDTSPISLPELADLPKLPPHWIYVRAEAISDFITKGTTPSKEELFSGAGDVPFIKVYNLTDYGLLDFTVNPTFVSRNTHEDFLGRSKVLPGDILMNIVGPPLGKVSFVSDKFNEWNINQAIVRYRTTGLLSNKYLMYYLLSQVTIDRMSKRAKATAGQFNLTLEICRDVEIPICTHEEQEQIVQELESRLSNCDQLENAISENLQKAEALRQSILKQAFEGKLVPQDPNDEPAEKLLERIRAERQTPGNTGKGKQSKQRQLTLPEV